MCLIKVGVRALLFFVLTACSSVPVFNTDGATTAGVASWYGARFQGRKTASGERFNMNEMTAAHRTLPFGTRVRVRSRRTGKEVVVRINDRGPMVASRIIDLSYAAAKSLGMISAGEETVEIIPLR